MRCARAFAPLNAGNKRLARIAIMAMTTSNSMSVNAKQILRFPRFFMRVYANLLVLQIDFKILIDRKLLSRRSLGQARQIPFGHEVLQTFRHLSLLETITPCRLS